MKKICEIYNQIEEKYLVFQLMISVCIIFYQVVMRYVFNNSQAWTEEVARYLYIWQGWLGISFIERKRKHISIEVLKNKLSGMPLLILQTFIQAVCIGTSAFMAYAGFNMVKFSLSTGGKSTALRLPLAVIYLAMPVGCTLYCLRTFFHMLEDLGIKKTDSEEVKA